MIHIITNSGISKGKRIGNRITSKITPTAANTGKRMMPTPVSTNSSGISTQKPTIAAIIKTQTMLEMTMAPPKMGKNKCHNNSKAIISANPMPRIFNIVGAPLEMRINTK